MGFTDATPIQEEAIPIVQNGSDIIACAQTGTGKTAAFLLPLLDKIAKNPNKDNNTRALIITPTRELAMQIDQQIDAIGYFLGVTSIPAYGGGDRETWAKQKVAFTQGADIIVATPGRLLSHIKLGYVDLTQIDFLVLDEADRMLDMGFSDDINAIIKSTNKERQTLLFSATMPGNIRKLAQKILKNPKHVSIAISKPAESIVQVAYVVHENQKTGLISHLLTGKKNYSKIIIFSSSKKNVQNIVSALKRKKFLVAGISSDLDQKEREAVLLSFRNEKINILVGTDIIARGIDIKDIDLVINYNVPSEGEDYVHRIGRTGRASGSGLAITLITSDEVYKFKRIEKLLERTIHKLPVPEFLGEAPEYKSTPFKGRGNSYKRKSGGGNRNKKKWNKRKPKKD